jgi:hypothetical protein
MAARSESSRLIDSIISLGAAPVLKEAGYRKVARSFFANTSPLAKVVQFQASMWNTPQSASFTINLNLVLPYFHEKWTGRPFPTNPGSAAAIATERIGHLMPDKRDHWWEVAPGCDCDRIASHVATCLTEYGLPFLDQHADLEVLIREVEDERATYRVGDPRLWLAMVLCYQQRHSEARTVLRDLAQANTHEGFGKTIDTIAGRLGLGEA